MDNKTLISELKSEVKEFVRSRDWTKQHNAKNLALSISIEAAELLEHFQWDNQKDVDSQLLDANKKNAVSAELADVIIYCLSFANHNDIDISEAIRRKMEINHDRFPPAPNGEDNDK